MSALVAQLKASILLEGFLNSLNELRPSLPDTTYRELTQKLADLEEHERCGEMAEAYGETPAANYEWDQPTFKPAF